MRALIPVLFLFVCSPLWAASKSDFAYGYSLEVDGDGAIYSLYLNEDIYKGITQADRADVRVFNSQGIAVPHYIRRNEQYTQKRESSENIDPPFFPLYRDEQPLVQGKQNIHITTNDQGSIIDINYGNQDPQTRILAGYIIDTSGLDMAPDKLILKWPADQGGFVSALQLEKSNDLTQWQEIVSRATISDLQYGQHKLVQNEIDLPVRKAKYLRLNWQGRHMPVLEKITLAFPDTYTVEAQPRQWSEYAAQRVDARTHTYYFDTSSLLPIDRIRVVLPQRNTLVRAHIESASSEQGPWTSRYSGLLYDLQQEGEQLRNPDIYPAINTHRYWRIHIQEETGQLGGEPVLQFGWIPEQLLFIAQGEAPFTLTYGSGRVAQSSLTLSQLLGGQSRQQQDRLIKPAHLGARMEFGDASRLQPAKPPTDWKRYVLWGVLVAGVLLLAFMVLRLYKQMDQSPPSG